MHFSKSTNNRVLHKWHCSLLFYPTNELILSKLWLWMTLVLIFTPLLCQHHITGEIWQTGNLQGNSIDCCDVCLYISYRMSLQKHFWFRTAVKWFGEVSCLTCKTSGKRKQNLLYSFGLRRYIQSLILLLTSWKSLWVEMKITSKLLYGPRGEVNTGTICLEII